jgi:hypothetical protein
MPNFLANFEGIDEIVKNIHDHASRLRRIGHFNKSENR